MCVCFQGARNGRTNERHRRRRKDSMTRQTCGKRREKSDPRSEFCSILSLSEQKKSMDVSPLCLTPIRSRFPSLVPLRETRIAIATISDRSPRKTAASRPRIASLMQSTSSSSTPSSTIPAGDALVLVPGDGVEAPSRWLAPFCAALDSERSVWLWFGGE